MMVYVVSPDPESKVGSSNIRVTLNGHFSRIPCFLRILQFQKGVPFSNGSLGAKSRLQSLDKSITDF